MNSDTGSALSIISILVSVGGAIYAAINHKRLRCKCCGKNLEVQVDVDSTEKRKSLQASDHTTVEVKSEEEAIQGPKLTIPSPVVSTPALSSYVSPVSVAPGFNSPSQYRNDIVYKFPQNSVRVLPA